MSDRKNYQLLIHRILILILVCYGLFSILAIRRLYFESKMAKAMPISNMYSETANSEVKNHVNTRKIILVGDSRAYQIQVLRDLRGSIFVNRGVPGETSSQTLLRFNRDVIDLDPDIIIIQVGINDLVAAMGNPNESGYLIDNLVGNIRTMATYGIHAGAKVLVTGIIQPARPNAPRLLFWSNRVRDYVSEVNQMLEEFEISPGVQFCDLNSILKSNQILPSEYAKDTLHLNEKGCLVVANEISQRLNEVAY